MTAPLQTERAAASWPTSSATARAETFPQLLCRNAERWGDRRVALREKELGIWQPVTWAAYRDHVRRAALGLMALGLQRGDKVAIVGDNRPEWVYAELAAQAAGAASVGLYQDAVAREVRYIVDHADARFVVVEDQEQVDKLLAVKDGLPRVERIIYYDPKGLRDYDDPLLLAWTELEALGERHGAEQPGRFEASVAAGRGSDLAIICYTSGTTGVPKGAMLSFDNLLSMARNLLAVDPLEPDDEFLSFLPLAWIGEQMMSLSCGLTVGFTVNFPEEPETVPQNLREIGPHVVFSPPRIWENMVSTVQVKMEDSTALKRWLYHRFLPVGYRVVESGGRAGPLDRLLYRLGELLVFAPIKDHLGLLRARRAYTGGAALGHDVFKFFHVLGVNLKQIYGQTEIAGISVVHRDGQIKWDTMGVPLPETELCIADDGEILQRSPAVFMGYYKDPEKTAETIVDGWLRSGDAGLIDADGHLVVIDRMKDVWRLADGARFSPQYIENKLKFSPYIKEAVVVGQDRPYVAALINIDQGNVGKWAENRGIAYTTYTDLAAKPAVYDLIARDVERVNADLPRAARIHRFVLLHKELDADDEELTRTRKVRRAFVAERYARLIEALYAPADSVAIEAAVRYQDGSTATVRTTLHIRTLATGEPAAAG